jgi:hypothetical protein
MESPLPPANDLNQDIYEFGLMAAASPEFAEAMLRALLAQGEPDPAAGKAAGPLRVAA